MTNRTLAIISYITLIGWLVAYLEYRKSTDRSPLVRYHLGQSLGLMIASVVLGLAVGIVTSIVPALSTILMAAGLIPLILAIFGIIAANNESTSPVPGIGKIFEGKFGFINQ